MTIKQKFIYFICALFILVAFAFFDFFAFKYVIDLFATDWKTHTIVFILLVVLVNPFITLFIMNKIPFKVKGLKVDKGIKEALKKESLHNK